MLGFEPGTGVTVAKYVAVAPLSTEVGPLTARVKFAVRVSVALAIFDGSATLVAVTATFAGEGRICGAV